MVKIIIPEALQRFVDGQTVLVCDISAINQLGDHFEKNYPKLFEIVFKGGELHGFINIYHNGNPVASLHDDIALKADDEVELLTSISGG